MKCLIIAGSLPLDESDEQYVEDYVAVKKVADGRLLGIQQMTYGNYRLQVGSYITPLILDNGY